MGRGEWIPQSGHSFDVPIWTNWALAVWGSGVRVPSAPQFKGARTALSIKRFELAL